MNAKNKASNGSPSQLDYKDKYILLKEFIDAHGDFTPKKLQDFQLFLELFLSDGIDFFQKEKFFDFLNNSLLPQR